MPKPFALACDLAGLRTLFVHVFIGGILFISAGRTLAEADGTSGKPGPLIVVILLLLIPARGLLNVRSRRTAWPPGAIAWAVLSIGYPLFSSLYLLLAASSPEQGRHPLCVRLEQRVSTFEGIAAVCVSSLYGVLCCMLSIRVEWRWALVALTVALNGLTALLLYVRCGDYPGHFAMQNTVVVGTSFALGEALRSWAEGSAVALTREYEAAIGAMRELVDSAHEEAQAAAAKADAMEEDVNSARAFHSYVAFDRCRNAWSGEHRRMNPQEAQELLSSSITSTNDAPPPSSVAEPETAPTVRSRKHRRASNVVDGRTSWSWWEAVPRASTRLSQQARPRSRVSYAELRTRLGSLLLRYSYM